MIVFYFWIPTTEFFLTGINDNFVDRFLSNRVTGLIKGNFYFALNRSRDSYWIGFDAGHTRVSLPKIFFVQSRAFTVVTISGSGSTEVPCEWTPDVINPLKGLTNSIWWFNFAAILTSYRSSRNYNFSDSFSWLNGRFSAVVLTPYLFYNYPQLIGMVRK